MVWAGNVCAGELCVFIELCVCVFGLSWCLLCGHMPAERVDGDVGMFSLVWGRCRSLGSTPEGFVCAPGYTPHVLPTALVGSVCDVY